MRRKEKVQGNTPEATIIAALKKLRSEGEPVSTGAVEKITSFTRVQIAGIIGRDYNLQTMFDEMRHA